MHVECANTNYEVCRSQEKYKLCTHHFTCSAHTVPATPCAVYYYMGNKHLYQQLPLLIYIPGEVLRHTSTAFKLLSNLKPSNTVNMNVVMVTLVREERKSNASLLYVCAYSPHQTLT